MGFVPPVFLAATAGFFVIAVASGSRAGGTVANSTRLQYARGPAGCLSEIDFRREVAIAGQTGEDRFGADGPGVLRVWFERLPDGRYRGTVRHTDAAGEKTETVELHSNCEVLGRWVALDAYYYLPAQPEPAADPAPQAPLPLPAWSPPPLPPQRFPPPALPAPSLLDAFSRLVRSMDLTIGLSGLVLMTAGYTDNVAPGFGIGIDVRSEYFSLGLELRGVLPSKAVARDLLIPGKARPPVEFDVGQLGALLVPCARFAKYFAGCAVLEPFWVTAQVSDATDFIPGFAVGPRFAVEVPLGDRFAAFGFAEALFAVASAGEKFSTPPNDPTVPGVLWDQSIVSGFFGVGLAVKFP